MVRPTQYDSPKRHYTLTFHQDIVDRFQQNFGINNLSAHLEEYMLKKNLNLSSVLQCAKCGIEGSRSAWNDRWRLKCPACKFQHESTGQLVVPPTPPDRVINSLK